MDKKTKTPDISALLAELNQLHAEIMAANGADECDAPGGGVRLLARVVPGLDLPECERLLRAAKAQGWFSLSLSDMAYPGLCSLYSLADSLPGEHCILTHALRPEPFLHHLREEAARAIRHSADLALIIFSGMEPLDEHGLLLLAEASRAEMGGGETLARFDEERLAIIVPAGRQLKARALAERIIDHFAAALPLSSKTLSSIAVHAGIACFTADSTYSDSAKISEKLREQALSILENAPANQARLFQNDTRPMSEKSILVQAGEKKFLFFGTMEQS